MHRISNLKIKLLPGPTQTDRARVCGYFEKWAKASAGRLDGIWLTDDFRPPKPVKPESVAESVESDKDEVPEWATIDPSKPQIELPSWKGWHATLISCTCKVSGIVFDVTVVNRLLPEPMRIYYSNGKTQICDNPTEKFNPKALI